MIGKASLVSEVNSSSPWALAGNREQAEGVVVPQVGLARGGKRGQVGQRAAVLWVHPGRVEALLIEGHVVVGVL